MQGNVWLGIECPTGTPTQDWVVLYQKLWQDPRDRSMNNEHLAFCNFKFNF